MVGGGTYSTSGRICAWALAAVLAAPAHAQDGGQLELEADRVESGDDGRIRAYGSPALRFGAGRLSARRIDLIEAERRIEAEGDVVLEDGEGNVLSGERLEFDFSARTGSVEPVEITAADDVRARLGGARMDAAGDIYTVRDAYYTSCPADMETWRVVADHFEYDAAGRIARAESAKLEIAGVPVMYMPGMSFSVDRRSRKSGFLTPSVEKRGDYYGVRTPYYFNLAENYDAMLEPVAIPRAGLFLGGEARYLQRGHAGNARLGYIASDRLAREHGSRYSVRAGVRSSGAAALAWGIEVERVSDDDYLRDFDDGREQTSRRNLPVRAHIEWESGNYRLLAEAETFQHLRDDTQRPHDQLPRVVLETEHDLGGVGLSSRTEVVNFRAAKAGEVEGLRVREDISASRTFGSQVRITPSAGVNLGKYALDGAPGDSSPDYAVPYLTVDGTMLLLRHATFAGREVEQTLEPRVRYGYVADRSFRGHPEFDTAVADINYTTLYDRRRFAGGDRFSRASYVSYGMTSRLLDVGRDLEVLQIDLVQRVNFADARPLLEGEGRDRGSLSNLFLAAEVSPWRELRAIARMAWNPDLDRMDLIDAGGELKLDEHRLVNASYYKALEEDGTSDSDLRAAALFPLSGKSSGLVRANYSLEDNHLSTGGLGFNYRGRCECWEMSAFVERYIEDEGNSESNIYFQFNLIGLGGLGSSRYEDEREGIGNLW